MVRSSSIDADMKALDSIVLETGFPRDPLPLPLLFVKFVGVASRFVGMVRLNNNLLRTKSFDLAKYAAIAETKKSLSNVLVLWLELDFRAQSDRLWPSAMKALSAFRNELGKTFRDWIDTIGVTEQEIECLTATLTDIRNLERSIRLLWAAVTETPSTTISPVDLHNAVAAVRLTKFDGKAYEWWSVAVQAVYVQPEPEDSHHLKPESIPREYRTRPMSLKEAARAVYGLGNRNEVKKLRAAIRAGTVKCEKKTREQHVFDLRDFPIEPDSRRLAIRKSPG